MTDEQMIELLEETRSKAQAMRDVLEGYELKIRDIEPPRADSVDLNVTTTDVVEFIYNAKIELDQAIESIDTILKPPATTEDR